MNNLESEYTKRFKSVLVPLAAALEAQLRDYFQDTPRIDRITVRPKGIKTFLQKASIVENDQPKYTEPFQQIQDQIGARVVTFFLSDVPKIAEVVEKYYRPIELRDVIPDSESEFGYFGKHYIFLLPRGILKTEIERENVPSVFEFQIKTLFQHAWSEADHDLGYKPGGKTPNPEQRRMLAYASAQAWGADRIFDELFRKLAT